MVYEITCKQCGVIFSTNVAQRVLCSRACVHAWQRDQAPESVNDCPCGKPIPVRNAQTGQRVFHKKKYCSPECRRKYGHKRKPNPDLYLTFACETCGGEVYRRKSYGTNQRFCSNACAVKFNHSIQHIGVDGIVLDSGYEALVWGLAKLYKIPLERFDRADCIPLKDGGWYGPDFIIDGIAVEVKGLEDQDDSERIAAWRATGKDLIVLRKEDLLHLVKSPKYFIAALSSFA